jgi:hypothetical protein
MSDDQTASAGVETRLPARFDSGQGHSRDPKHVLANHAVIPFERHGTPAPPEQAHTHSAALLLRQGGVTGRGVRKA